MHTNRIIWVAGIIALIAKECSNLYRRIIGARWKIGGDEGVPVFICHVSIIQPDLSAWLERIIWNAHNDRGFPSGEARQISRIGGNHARDADFGPGENINSLMKMIPAHGVAPEKADKAI